MLSSDAELLAGTAAGDVACFEALYRRHATRCRQRARSVLGCEDWVQDVVQTVFLDVWSCAGRFDERRGSARAWLLQLTHHKAVDLIRAQQRYTGRCAREDLLDQHEDLGPTPDQVVATAEASARLHDQVAHLPLVQREAVRLFFLCGLSQKEVAEQLGVPVATLKTRTHRGIVELRKRLDRSLLQDA